MARGAFRDGFSDNLEPVVSIDVANTTSVDALLKSMKSTGFGGRTLGEAADTLEAMVRDPDCMVVATLAGAMTVAKMGLVLCEMIDRGWINAIVSTGALMAHGFVEGRGCTHFKYNPNMNDEQLYERGYDRVYDTLELEQNLLDAEHIVDQVVDALPQDTVLSSHRIMWELGRYLDDTLPTSARAILKSCYHKGVPVYVPAFTDSEMGLNVELLNQRRMRDAKPRRLFDPFIDLQHYAHFVSEQKRTGIFTIGGGVPRNWAQQLGPLVNHLHKSLGRNQAGFRFRYALRICPEPVHWGGLSGCTYSEGVSWGKFVPTSEGGVHTEVYCDATIAWPILVRGLIERLGDTTIDKNLPSPKKGKLGAL